MFLRRLIFIKSAEPHWETPSMCHKIIIMLGLLLVFLSSDSWGWTLVTHPGVQVRGGLEYAPICPQGRNTPKAPDEFYQMKNPLEPTSEVIFSGQTLFHFDAKPGPCRLCHGISGNGLGTLVRELSPSPRNFACSQTMKDIPDGQLFWIIRNGSPGTAMPAFKNLDDDQIWQLIHYIRHFAK